MTAFASLREEDPALTVPPFLLKLPPRITVEPERSIVPLSSDAPPESVKSLFCTVSCPELDSKPLTTICGVPGKSSSRFFSAISADSVLLKAIFLIL